MYSVIATKKISFSRIWPTEAYKTSTKKHGANVRIVAQGSNYNTLAKSIKYAA